MNIAWIVAYAWIVINNQEYYRISAGNNINISFGYQQSATGCKVMTYTNPKDIFVPKKTIGEWNSFIQAMDNNQSLMGSVNDLQPSCGNQQDDCIYWISNNWHYGGGCWWQCDGSRERECSTDCSSVSCSIQAYNPACC